MGSAIIVVNDDLTEQVKSVFTRQLFLSETIDGAEFDARVVANPNYLESVHLMNLRVLVIRPLTDTFSRVDVDYVVFFKAGLVSVEYNKYGPPGLTLPLDRLYLNRLIFNQ